MSLKSLIQQRMSAGGEGEQAASKSSQEHGAAPVFYPVALKRFHTGKGDIIVPNEDGVYVPNTQEEFDILCWHLEQGRVSLTDPSVVDEGQNPDDVTE